MRTPRSASSPASFSSSGTSGARRPRTGAGYQVSRTVPSGVTVARPGAGGGPLRRVLTGVHGIRRRHGPRRAVYGARHRLRHAPRPGWRARWRHQPWRRPGADGRRRRRGRRARPTSSGPPGARRPGAGLRAASRRRRRRRGSGPAQQPAVLDEPVELADGAQLGPGEVRACRRGVPAGRGPATGEREVVSAAGPAGPGCATRRRSRPPPSAKATTRRARALPGRRPARSTASLQCGRVDGRLRAPRPRRRRRRRTAPPAPCRPPCGPVVVTGTPSIVDDLAVGAAGVVCRCRRRPHCPPDVPSRVTCTAVERDAPHAEAEEDRGRDVAHDGARQEAARRRPVRPARAAPRGRRGARRWTAT